MQRPITNHHFSHVHASFWLGIEHCSLQCSNIRQNPIPDENRYLVCMTDAPEIGARFLTSIDGAGFCHVCHGPKFTLTADSVC